MSATIEPRLVAVGTFPSPGRAPPCGARKRSGGACLGLAMGSGRCRIHGGASTGPRTAAGLARMVAAKTTHGGYAASGAPARALYRWARTLNVRIMLTAEATRLQAYLPPGMAARLDMVPEALISPKHPSQVAFEARQAAACRTDVPARLGLGRRARAARARLGAGGGVDAGAAVALRGRAAERLATRAETASQAPWRAAIAAARALKRDICEARGQMRGACNDPMGGSEGSQPGVASNDPIGGTGGRLTRASRNDPIGGSDGQSWGASNDPIGGSAVRVEAAGAPLDRRVGVLAERRAGDTAGWVPGAPGLAEVLARELEKRWLRAGVGLRGNDPIGGPTAGAGAGDAGRVVLAGPRVGSTRGLALGGTTLARMWEPGVAEVLAARFGPAVVAGWLGGPVAPPGIAAMPSGGGAQRPYGRVRRMVG